MNILVLNGSPRKGNTYTAIQAFTKGVSQENTVEVVDTYKLHIAPCKACGVCQCQNGCIDKDDTNMIVDKIENADMIVFASPVYWWGITAQLKMVIDKCYCKGALLKNKKVGTIIIGADAVTGVQYELIQKQFACIADYLAWDIVFSKSYSADKADDLAKNQEAISELENILK